MENVIEYFMKGGIVMYFLLFGSIIAMSVVIEKLYSLRRKKIIIPEIVNLIENIKSRKDIELALSLCKKHEGPFANIVLTGLENMESDKDELKDELSDSGRQEAYKIGRGLGVLETIAGISPLLGLLGTVIGILKVFNVIQKMGVGQAQSMAGGISEALITTIAGLAIAIPAVVAYNYFSEKTDTLVLEMEKYSSILIKKLRYLNHGKIK